MSTHAWSVVVALTVAIIGVIFIGFQAIDSEMARIRDRLRALELTQHVHKRDGEAVWPPHWRPR